MRQEVLEIDSDDFVPETQPVLVVQEDDFEPTGLSSDELRRRILELFTNVQVSYIDLSRCLYEAYMSGKAKSWGYGSWKEYVQKELAVKVGKANYLKKIWEHYGKEPELLEQMKPVGWEKMKELTRIMTKENASYWLEKASHLSCDDLKKEVKSHLKNLVPDNAKDMMEKEDEVRGGPVEKELHSHTFQFHYDSKAAVLTAVEKVQKETGTSASESLALICADYLGSAQDGDGLQHVLNIVNRYENNLPVKFIVVDTSKNELIYGAQTLAEWVKIALAQG